MNGGSLPGEGQEAGSRRRDQRVPRDGRDRFGHASAKAVAALSHPNTVSIFDFGTHAGVSYAVMELLEGETLRETNLTPSVDKSQCCIHHEWGPGFPVRRVLGRAGVPLGRRSGMREALFIGVCCLALAGAAGAAGAAEIHGTVSEDGKTLPQGVTLKLDCSGTSASAQTDQFGSYSLKIAATGECVLSLEYKKSNLSVKVTVYEKPS